MSIAKTYSAQLIGLEINIVTVEVDISNGLHSFSVVGLGDRSVEESKDRISAAIKNSGYISPKQKNQKVVISLAPADTRKEGTAFDLAMTLGYLMSAGEISFESKGVLFLGELSLEGNVRKVSGILPILCQAVKHGFNSAFIPIENREEASLAQGIKIYPTSSPQEVVRHLSQKNKRGKGVIKILKKNFKSDEIKTIKNDMCFIRGNESAKRGLEISAAGAHNILMYGPPGTGKTMLAQSFQSILPPLSYEQSVEVTGIHSVARTLTQGLIRQAPFRAPHHTASYPSIVGGGAFPKPGEITLAHRGVLFLDEFPEFDRKVIEALRQPLEDRTITISRTKGVVTFPAQCILIASMNPCPCGKEKNCTCSLSILENYRRKISGPIIDRMDLWINVNKVDYEKLSSNKSVSENSEIILNRVKMARNIQSKRFAKFAINKNYNSEMDVEDIERCIVIDDEAKDTLRKSAEQLGLSGRAFHRIIKVAQTIADLAQKETIQNEHILEAIQYRQKI